jgi:hypothetical protein
MALACGPDWTYIGHPPWMVLCMTASNSDPSQYLVGTYGTYSTPGSGGVYRYSGQDTTWIYSGLTDCRVWKLKRFPAYPNAIFAVGTGGIYRSDDDGNTWTLLTQVTRYREPIDFAISPTDSTEWVCATVADLSEMIYLSRDAGQTWHQFFFGRADNLFYSELVPGRLIYSVAGAIYQCQIADSTFTIVDNPGTWIRKMIRHPSRPWYYTAALQHISRYDEFTGDCIDIQVPDSIGSIDHVICTPDTEIYFGGGGGIFRIAEDLSGLTPVTTSLPIGPSALEYANSQSWVAHCFSEEYYCISREVSVDPRPAIASPQTIEVYPNPARERVCFVLERPSQLVVYNLLGQTVYRGQSSELQRTLTWLMNPPVSGTYYYTVDDLHGASPSQSGSFAVVK